MAGALPLASQVAQGGPDTLAVLAGGEHPAGAVLPSPPRGSPPSQLLSKFE